MGKLLWQRWLGHLDQFMGSSALLNSNNLKKSILILVLGANDFIKWMAWLYLSNRNPDHRQWINQDFYGPFMVYQMIGIVIFWSMILICHRYKAHAFTQRYMPFIAVGYLCSVYLYNGYCIGMMSPATIASYVNLVCLGLVLFTRNIVYSVLIPFTILILSLIILCAFNLIPYAPLFSEKMNNSVVYNHPFWVFSMMIVYIPIFFTSIVIFELLLLQWRNRENLVNEISQKDPLTGLSNRRVIDQTLLNLNQAKSSYAVILIDLDFFKNVNDQYGHDVGDHVLRRVAQVLSTHTRGGDIAGRFGGEEFMMIVSAKSLYQVTAIAERCRKQIEIETFTLNDGVILKVSASFGIAFSQSGMTQEQVIKSADQALYTAKEKGRNQVQVFNQSSGIA